MEDDSHDMDLLTMCKEYLKEKYQKPGNVYCGLVHRLDRPVGGVMVFAKTSKAASRLSESVRTHQLKKEYLAILDGIPTKKSDTLEDYLSKDTRTNTVSVTDAKHGKKCQFILRSHWSKRKTVPCAHHTWYRSITSDSRSIR